MILIRNGRLIDPKTKRDEVVDILIKDNKIEKIGNIDENDVDRIIDAKGCIVSPGLIDVHVHFRDPGFTHKEDILTGSASAAKGGFTTVVCMANTNPIVDNEETLDYINEKAKLSSINVLQASAITKGFKGKEIVDMDKMIKAGAVGFTDDGLPIMDSDIILKAMNMAKERNVPLSFHEEDPSLITCAGINDGKISKQMGILGAPNVAEDVMVSRDCMLALKSGAKVNIQHISSKNSVEMVRFIKKLGANVYAEATPHHFTLTEDDVLTYGTNAKMNPPLRTLEDKMAIIEGLKDDTIEIIATDHAPHTYEEKNVEFTKAPSGIIGLETALSLGITSLVKNNHLNMMKLIEKMTINPARLYNLESGSIEEGKVADIVIFDENEEFVVDKFVSKCENTPFKGHKLFGKVKYTICGGKAVFEEKK
ncbi:MULTISPECIES: dihydroorotase [Romboutsia]|uniref:Dihydroorotase n=1 Tax=Romboutsia hominis TaxID=1507512 RepID=A0A2P2BQP0_9FIRM|nr:MULTISPECIES: dihydroorotase [Romboutsia]MDB8803524.1 dihydroorotase [Romboutsia sp. 1001216sp1]MDB8808464.1 dihydroorotase [Romboutsia sp. 1001216sp1]MDB8809172.1 dihydroorotase [Romboutsia sp. 1001216sp1]MDB8814920.1 dihydroorotase [Romboutsia sp. 1001216sp1]MDB8819653.1 dihydroorotase [Romboutsia sp. 1001216sp1]